ncbi:MAG: hypothetical protein HY720_07435 [Planctomycetes bacterium]|nr:hypothetical protein [Planctomycetota bacterium]
MSEPNKKKGRASVRPPSLAQVLYSKIESIKKDHPIVSRRIDELEEEIRRAMSDIKEEVGNLKSEEEQKLMTILLINEIHRSVEGILTAG